MLGDEPLSHGKF